MLSVMHEKVSYGGWANCVRLSNAQVELIATTDVGPRIIRFSFVGSSNVWKEIPEHAGKTGSAEWRSYGGHRLWQAPGDFNHTYAPDSSPIAHAWDGRSLKLSQPTDATGLGTEIEIVLDPERTRVSLLHRLTNRKHTSVELGAWAVTVMAAAGRAIFPEEPYRPHHESLLPVRTISMWSYPDMKDPRLSWGTRYIQLRQDPASKVAQKFGPRNMLGWAAYVRQGVTFIMRFPFDRSARYPDMDCNFEVFTNAAILEMESLGPMTRLDPGASVEHAEEWFLFRAEVGEEEAAIDGELLPLLAQTQAPQRQFFPGEA
jgi:hypothetical protein